MIKSKSGPVPTPNSSIPTLTYRYDHYITITKNNSRTKLSATTMSQTGRTFDLMIFGATSFTGKWLLREVVKMLENGNQFTWAISGRSLTKMETVLREISNEIGKELQVPKIVADVKKPSTIVEMVKQCRVLLNLVGPYIEFGEVVVNACAQEGTHYVDVHGEPLFSHRMEEKYSSVAERSGAYIVGSCGLGVIPSDCGAAYLEQHFDGEELSSIESFLELVDESGNVSFANMKVHSGSYHSVILMLHHIRELLAFKSKRSEKFPQPDHKLVQSPFTFRKEVNGWTLSELPIGEIMAKSQEYAVLKLKRKPIQIASYTVFSSVLPIIIMILMGTIVAAIAQFKLGMQFLLKFPKIFSCGMSSHEGPSMEASDKVSFTFTLIAKGWEEVSEKHDEPPNKIQVLKVRGLGAAYNATSKMMLQAALTILNELGRMPPNGGVYTPGIAFANTSLVDRLHRSGITFSLQN